MNQPPGFPDGGQGLPGAVELHFRLLELPTFLSWGSEVLVSVLVLWGYLVGRDIYIYVLCMIITTITIIIVIIMLYKKYIYIIEIL